MATFPSDRWVELPPGAAKLMLTVERLAQDGELQISYAQAAEASGMSERTVQKMFHVLIDEGALSVVADRHSTTSRTYRVERTMFPLCRL